MDSAFQVIEKLKRHSGKLAKEEILKANEFNDEFKLVLYATYEPTLNYYIRKLPSINQNLPTASVNTLTYAIKVLLEQLSTRKVTGADAKKLLLDLAYSISREDREVLELILNRDLKCGISDKTILKVFPNIVSYFPYMRCSTSGTVDYPALSEEKADGIFCRAIVTQGEVALVNTRQGSPLVSLPVDFLDAIRELPTGVYEGELLLKGDEEVFAREVGNGLINKYFIKATLQCPRIISCVYQMWDMLDPDVLTKKVDKTPRITRLNNLEAAVDSVALNKMLEVIPYKVVNTLEEAKAHYQELLAEGKEGTVLKDMNAIWKDGTSKHQIKMKQEVVVELRAIDLNPAATGSKNEDTFGSILFRSECGLLEVNVTGIPDAQRKEIFDNWNYYQNKVASVKANGIMHSKTRKPHSLFLPRFVEWRDADKTVADTFEYIEEVFKNG